MVPTNTDIFLRGLKLCREIKTQRVLLVSKRKFGVSMHFSEITMLQFGKKKKQTNKKKLHTLLCILLFIRTLRIIVTSLIAELIVCLTIESHRCGSRRFDRYAAGLHQAMVSTECVTV